MKSIHESLFEMMEVFETRQLRAFQVVAETRSFTAAAQKLFLTQSAVSHSIKALEQAAGCRLLDRLGKTIVLTQAGEILLGHANVILGCMQSAGEDLREMMDPDRGRIRIGMAVTTCQYVLPEVLREFKEQFPSYEVSVTAGDTRELLEQLDGGDLDLAVTLYSEDYRRLDFQELFEDQLGFIVSPQHSLAQTKRIDRARLEGEQFLFYSRDSETYRILEAFCGGRQIPLKTAMELGSMAAIVEMAKLGLGIGIVAPWIALDELESGELVHRAPGSTGMQRRWGIYTDQRRERGAAENLFGKLCGRVFEKIVERQEVVLGGGNALLAGASSRN